MKTSEILQAARKLIEKPEMWRKDAYGDSRSPKCAIGALRLASDRDGYGDALVALAAEIPMPYVKILSSFNDAPTTTHADILALYDRAIAAEQAKEAACSSS